MAAVLQVDQVATARHSKAATASSLKVATVSLLRADMAVASSHMTGMDSSSMAVVAGMAVEARRTRIGDRRVVVMIGLHCLFRG